MTKDDEMFDPVTETMIHGLDEDFKGEPTLGDKVTYRSNEQAIKDFRFFTFRDHEMLNPGGTSAVEHSTGHNFRVIRLSAIIGREIAVIDGLSFVFIIDRD